ncbi:MAG TPA: hypothetical protein VFI72_06360 [Candidatus Angelobacter sp.]|nr:hypothetical protein [Candidatus Angelobacter sp.]
MTLTEIDDQLPNGFHDAEVGQFSWNFAEGIALFDLILWTGTQDSPEIYRRGRIELQQISFIVLEPPQVRSSDPKPYRSSVGSLQVDGVLTDETNLANFRKLKQELAPSTEIFSFYVVNWNSFIHVAANDAKLTWTE